MRNGYRRFTAHNTFFFSGLGTPALSIFCWLLWSISSEAVAQNDKGVILESYVAYLGPRDEVNSLGQRLFYLHQMIEQDRANVHEFNIVDPEDRLDSLFHSFGMRTQLSKNLSEKGAVGPFFEGLPKDSRTFRVVLRSHSLDGFSAELSHIEGFNTQENLYACTMIEISQEQCSGLQF